MQKIVFVLALLWFFVFLFPRKNQKFFFLTIVDSIIFIFLFILQLKYIFIILLLMFITNFLVLYFEEDEIIFEKKDFIFFVFLFFILFLTISGAKYKNIFPVKIILVEQMQFAFLFLLVAIICFFILEKILLSGDNKK